MIAQLTHAVLTDTHMIYKRDHERLTRAPLAAITGTRAITVCDLLTLADTHGLHTLWVCPGTCYSETLTHGFIETVQDYGYEYRVSYRANNERGKADHIARAQAWKKEGTPADRRSIYIIIPQWALWEWEETDPIAVLAAIHYIECALPIRINQGAALAGRDLVKQQHGEKHQAWLRKPEIDYATIPYSEAGKDIAFTRQITYKDGLYIHAYDKNSMYLGAATGALLGAGTPDHITGRAVPNLKLPGIWHCTIDIADSPYNGTARPCPLSKNQLAQKQQWITTPLLKLCLDLGYKVEILEGYQWQEHHRTLEQWGNALWTARTQLKTDHTSYPHEHGRELAASGVKRIATAGLGLFDSDKSAKYDPAWYRPDFWVTIVELAKERMIRKAIQIEQLAGIVPFAGVTDCWYYLSPDPNPYTAIPGITEREDKLGGFKVKHQALPLTPALLAALICSVSAGKVAKIIRLYEQAVRGE